jgi:hypothetical protein
MARSPRGSGTPRRPRVEARTPRESVASRPTEASARALDVRRTEVPAESVSQESTVLKEGVATAPRFRIFIVDAGWNSAAHKVLVENFALLRGLQKEDPIYVLSKEQSIEFQRHHGTRIGRDPIIAVHDLAAMDKSGTTDFHGFRLSLGLLRTPQQALQGLQSFARFLVTHRQSMDLEADIRADLRREGLAGAIEIILHHEARDIVNE